MAKQPRNLIVNLSRRTVVSCETVVADRVTTRVKGLLGRDSLAAGEGVLLIPAPSIHTAFMRFSIDVVFLSTDLEVLKIVPRLEPWRVAAARGAHAALELEAGAAQRSGTRVGDRLGVLDLNVSRSEYRELGRVH